MTEQEQKYQAVKKELQGLDVEYLAHGSYRNESQINMARINGFSIVWHEFAYCQGEPDTVEVMLPDRGEYDNIEGHYPIRKLRKLVTK